MKFCGRHLGFSLSAKSKQAISDSKRGQRHTEATKDKISRTLMLYFRNIHPLSKELLEDYASVLSSDEDAKDWYEKVREALDNSSGILTEKSLNSKRMREVTIEYNIDMSNNQNNNISAFVNNPESMCELKMLCEKEGLSFSQMVKLIDNDCTYSTDIVKTGLSKGTDSEERST
jgi:hypothetical protein